MTDPIPCPSHNHLARIRGRLALLVAHLEAANRSHAPTPHAAATALTLGKALLHQLTLAEQSIARDRDATAALARIDQRYRDSFLRLDALHDEVERLPSAERPDPDARAASSGSTIGDAVRDGFLHMG